MPAEDRQAWVVRHGDTEWSKAGRHTGRTDVPLVESGREQAEGLRSLLATHRFGIVLSSPLQRAMETAALAGFGDQAQADADLAEWDYGEYDGLTSAEIRKRDPDWSLWDTGGPGGEAPGDVGRRADRVVERLRDTAGEVLVFSHGHFLRVLASRWVGLAPADGRLLHLGTAGLGVLGHDRATPVIRAWNISSDGGPA